MRIVLDTNVLVSGLLNAAGPPGRIVDGVLCGALQVLYDDRILAEYREVLGRPRFGFHSDEVAAVLDVLMAEGERVSALPLTMRLPDPDDLPFLEVAQSGCADALVTGNLAHFPEEARRGLGVLSPAAFVERWAERSRSGLPVRT